jgi:TetR/AcrR family tetracycline transcriptional repressor
LSTQEGDVVERITVASLVQAGFEAVEEHGLSGLTMRDVAQRLGVKAPAIYWHLKSRRDLVDEMATEMWRRIDAEVGPISAGLSAEEALVGFAREVRRQALDRRDGARLLAGTYLTDDTLLRDQQARLEALGAAEHRQRVVTAYALVYSFVIGYVIEEQARRQAPGRYSAERRAERLGDPEAVELSAAVLDNSDDRFEELLGLIMTTVRRDVLRPT